MIPLDGRIDRYTLLQNIFNDKYFIFGVGLCSADITIETEIEPFRNIPISNTTLCLIRVTEDGPLAAEDDRDPKWVTLYMAEPPLPQLTFALNIRNGSYSLNTRS